MVKIIFHIFVYKYAFLSSGTMRQSVVAGLYQKRGWMNCCKRHCELLNIVLLIEKWLDTSCSKLVTCDSVAMWQDWLSESVPLRPDHLNSWDSISLMLTGCLPSETKTILVNLLVTEDLKLANWEYNGLAFDIILVSSAGAPNDTDMRHKAEESDLRVVALFHEGPFRFQWELWTVFLVFIHCISVFTRPVLSSD